MLTVLVVANLLLSAILIWLVLQLSDALDHLRTSHFEAQAAVLQVRDWWVARAQREEWPGNGG